MSAPTENPRSDAERKRRRSAVGRHDLHAAPTHVEIAVLRSDEDVRLYADKLREMLKESGPGRSQELRVPSPEAIAHGQMKTLSDWVGTGTPAVADSALVDTIGPSWSSAKLRSELGDVSRQALNQRVKRGTLLGLPTSDGATVYPVFQFRRRGVRVEIMPGLPSVLKALTDQSAWAVAVLLNTAAPELDGATPVEWARRGGDAARLEELAGVLKRERSRQ